MAAAVTQTQRPPQSTHICILYASQTGTAQDVAERIGREAGRRGFSPHVCALDEYKIEKLPSEKLAVFVAATTGDGDAPDNMKGFWRFLLQRNLPKTALDKLAFSVFGLGDSGYAKFNATARKLQQRLLQLGASEFCSRGLGDDQSEPLGMDGDLEEWLKQMWDQALKLHPLPPGCAIDDSPELLACRYSLIPCVGPSSSADSAGTQRGDFLVQVPQNAHSCTDGASLFQATLKTNNRMTGHDWSQDVRHLEFEATQLPAALKAGDIASVWPQSPPQLVQRLCTRLGADPKIRILTVSQTSSSHAPKAGVVQSAQSPAFAQPPQGSAVPTSAVTALPSTLTVESLFSNFIDIAGVPRRSCFEQLSFFSHGNPEEAEKLREISGPAGADLYASYAKKEKRNIVEILEDFKSVQVPISFLLELLPPIAPRHFSIASSPTLDSGKLHLCMAVVQYKTPFKRNINGLCSTWLAHMTEGTQLTMCVRPGLLRLPSAYSAACTLAASASTAATAMQAAPPMPAQLPPFILIGPGTGVAPMRGMLRELQAAGPPSRGHSSAWDARLYFGCRKAAEDHLYADEWQAMQASGTLAVYRAAFSRDGPTKVYVQTLLWEDREAVAAALQHPQCSLFIAGNAKRMPTDVLAVLQKIIEAAGATEMQAKAHLALMQREQRLVIEAWS